MGRRCCVPGCQTGSSIREKGVSLFSLPKDHETREKWRELIPRTRYNRPLGGSDLICGLHFEKEDVGGYYDPMTINGQIVLLEKGLTKLRKRSIPKFRLPAADNAFYDPPHKQSKLPRKKYARNNPYKLLTQRSESQLKVEPELYSEKTSENNNPLEPIVQLDEPKLKPRPTVSSEDKVVGSPEHLDEPEHLNELEHLDEPEHLDECPEEQRIVTYQEIADNYCNISLPSTSWGAHKGPTLTGSYVAFTCFSFPLRNCNKTVLFEGNTEPTVFFSNRSDPSGISPSAPFYSLNDVSKFLREVDGAMFPCRGALSDIKFSKNCRGYMLNRKSKNIYQCSDCSRLKYRLETLKML